MRPDRTITLPDEIAAGTIVAVVALPSIPSMPEPDDVTRKARFEATLKAIQAASAAGKTAPTISDDQLDTLIKKAKQTST